VKKGSAPKPGQGMPIWRKLTGGFIFAALFLLILSPELALFSFLLDAAVIDAVIILTGIQLQLHWLFIKDWLTRPVMWCKRLVRSRTVDRDSQ
jgi:hypothetical protein